MNKTMKYTITILVTISFLFSNELLANKKKKGSHHREPTIEQFFDKHCPKRVKKHDDISRKQAKRKCKKILYKFKVCMRLNYRSGKMEYYDAYDKCYKWHLKKYDMPYYPNVGGGPDTGGPMYSF